MKIVYLIPEFPGQTHIMFWRERLVLSELQIATYIVSTRRPPKGVISHSWAAAAADNTYYLTDMGIIGTLKAVVQLFRLGPQGWLNITKIALQDCPAKSMPRNFLYLLVAMHLVNFMKIHGLRHIHSHSCADSALIALFASKLGKFSYSMTLHGDLSDYGRQQKVKWRNAAFAITITNKLCTQAHDTLSPHLPRQIVVAPMGIDPDVCKRQSRYLPWSGHGPVRLFSCGRLNYVKGHQDLIQAVFILKSFGLDAMLEIAGEDEEGGHGFRRELVALIENFQLGSSVVLLGAVSEQYIVRRLETAHIFVLASHHEPLGVAIMEAMSCEVPVISTDSGGVPELVRSGSNGCLVPPKDPVALARAIQRVAHDQTLARLLSTNGRAAVVKHFNCKLSALALAELVAHAKQDDFDPFRNGAL